MKLDYTILPIIELSKEQKHEMYLLMDTYYANSSIEQFENDLKEKNWVLLLFCNSSIIGFSTQKLFEVNVHNEDILVLFSGDTIIDRQYWGSMTLSIAFGKLMLIILEQNKGKKLYWMLISKGLRTYKYLTNFMVEYYPNNKTKTPYSIKELMDYLGYLKYPNNYNKETGIIEAKQGSQHLVQDHEPSKNEFKEHELFFYKANPGYAKGDELLCLTQLSLENMHPFMQRVFRKFATTV